MKLIWAVIEFGFGNESNESSFPSFMSCLNAIFLFFMPRLFQSMGVVLVKKKHSSSGIQENGAGYYEVQTDLHADSSIAHIVIIDDDDPGQIGSLQTQPQRSPDAGHICM